MPIGAPPSTHYLKATNSVEDAVRMWLARLEDRVEAGDSETGMERFPERAIGPVLNPSDTSTDSDTSSDTESLPS